MRGGWRWSSKKKALDSRSIIQQHQELNRKKKKTSKKRKTFFGTYTAQGLGRKESGTSRFAVDPVVRKCIHRSGRQEESGKTSRLGSVPEMKKSSAMSRRKMERLARADICKLHGPAHLRFLRKIFVEALAGEDRRQNILRTSSGPKQRRRLQRMFKQDRAKEQALLLRIRSEIGNYVNPDGPLFPTTMRSINRPRTSSGIESGNTAALPLLESRDNRPSSASARLKSTSRKRGTFFGTFTGPVEILPQAIN